MDFESPEEKNKRLLFSARESSVERLYNRLMPLLWAISLIALLIVALR